MKRRTRRAHAPRMGKRQLMTAMLAIVALLVPTVLLDISGANTVDGIFELDGDTLADTPGQPGVDDWENLVAPNSPTHEPVAVTAIPISDGADSPNDTTYFHGGGSKDVNDISRWRWSTTDVAPDKNELVNGAAAAYRNTDGDLILTFATDRFSNDGDAAAGFWFFKNRVVPNTDGGFDGVHTDGDVFIVSDFNEGENINTVRVFEWKNGGLEETNLGSPGPFDCQDPAAHDPDLCATQNSVETVVAAGWDYTPKPNIGTSGSHPAWTFLEGSINHTAVFGPDADQCFATFMAETRSSTKPTAQLKDFVLGDFPVCAPGTTLSASTPESGTADPEVVVAGDSVTVTFTEENSGNVPLTDVFVEATNCGTVSPASVPTLDPGDTATFTCTVSTTAGTAEVIDVVGTGHGTDPSGRDTTFCTDPTDPPVDTVCDQNERDSARIVTIVPSTDLDASASPDPVKAGQDVTFTITETNDGVAPTGYERNLDLTNVSVTVTGALSDLADQCNTEMATGPVSGDDGDDGVLSDGETWTYTCTVKAPATSVLTDGKFELTFDGSGTVLAGTVYSVVVSRTGDVVDLDEQAKADVTVIDPSTTLMVTADALITYTFAETNDGDAALTPPTPTDRTSVIDPEASTMCSETALTYTGGDVNDDMILDPGETWTFTCQGTLSGPTGDTGSTDTTEAARGHGTDDTGDDVTWCEDTDDDGQLNQPDDTTYCDQDERDSVTVTIENHPRGPESG